MQAKEHKAEGYVNKVSVGGKQNGGGTLKWPEVGVQCPVHVSQQEKCYKCVAQINLKLQSRCTLSASRSCHPAQPALDVKETLESPSISPPTPDHLRLTTCI